MTVPEDFLNTATYPVVVDPTFGYTTQGGTNGAATDDFVGSEYTSPSDYSSLDSVHVRYVKGGSGTAFKTAITNASLNYLTNGVSDGQVGVNGWNVATYTTPPTLAASTVYVLGALVSSASGGGSVLYDTGGGASQGALDLSNSYASPTNPTDASRDDSLYSIYVTYTASSSFNPAFAHRRLLL